MGKERKELSLAQHWNRLLWITWGNMCKLPVGAKHKGYSRVANQRKSCALVFRQALHYTLFRTTGITSYRMCFSTRDGLRNASICVFLIGTQKARIE